MVVFHIERKKKELSLASLQDFISAICFCRLPR